MRTVQCASFSFLLRDSCAASNLCLVLYKKQKTTMPILVQLPLFTDLPPNNFTFVVFNSVVRTRSLSLLVIYSLRKNMGRNGMCFSTILFLLCFTSGIGHTIRLVQGQKTWCIAKPSTDEGTLIANLNYACSQVDCSVLQKGKPCFNPDNLISHSSVAMNLYYQSRGRNAWNCNFKNAAVVVLTDPSYGGCMFA